MEQPGAEATWYLLEKQQQFSRSLLWQLQQHYFAERGVEAWRQGEVPHYVTSNPTVANSYAEIVFAFWRDLHDFSSNGTVSPEPLTLCELGAGSGRFAFHFLARLSHLCEQAGVPLASFRYVLTDLASSNLDFWQRHPRFQSWFDSGVLDVALFDVNQSTQLNLQRSGQILTSGSLQQPAIAIANYVFDSIPQELYYIHDHQCKHCVVSLMVEEDPNSLTAAELLTRLHYHYDYQDLATAAVVPPASAVSLPEIIDSASSGLKRPVVALDLEAALQALLTSYQNQLSNTHLLFPAAGLRCLQRLKTLSQQGLMVLSADKGDRTLASLQGKSPPRLVHHGSFSLAVNYHAFQAFCQQSSGLALFPTCHHNSINVGCLLMVEDAANYHETQRAYRRHVQDFSPDDFYSITKHARQHIVTMTVEDILAYLRLSFYDSHQFARYLPRLLELAPGFDRNEQQAVIYAIAKVWELYFPLGETLDLAHQIANLLYAMDEYALALAYFQHSIEIYGQDTGTLYNMAVCYQLLGQDNQAEPLLQTILACDPNNQAANALLVSLDWSDRT